MPDPHPLFSVSQECVGTSGQAQDSNESKYSSEPVNVPRNHRMTYPDENIVESEEEWIQVKSKKSKRSPRDERNKSHTVS